MLLQDVEMAQAVGGGVKYETRVSLHSYFCLRLLEHYNALPSLISESSVALFSY